MKVKFLKKYRGIKTFNKGDVVKIHHTLARELIKKKIVIETKEITQEDIALKQLEETGDGNKLSD